MTSESHRAGQLSGLSIQRIPPEVLAKIFTFCLSTKSEFIIPDPNQAPLLLLQVCSDWRTCAMNTPQLWCSLETSNKRIVEKVRRHEPVEQQLTFIRNWFVRAGSLPLSIRVTTQTHSNVSPDSDDYMRTLQSYFPRCCSLTLDTISSAWVCSLSGIEFPVLEELVVSYSFTPSIEPRLDVPIHAPLLQKLRLRGPNLNWASSLPLATIGELDFRHSGHSEIESTLPKVLRQCHSLRRCSIVIRKGNLSEEIRLSKLVQLDVHACGPDIDLNSLLCHFRLPALRILSLNDNSRSIRAPALIDLIFRSPCYLVHLKISSRFPVCRDDGEFRNLLQAIPSLQVLDLCTISETGVSLFEKGSDHILRSLVFSHVHARDRPGYNLVPNLTELTIRGMRVSSSPSRSDVQAILRSRIGTKEGDESEKLCLRSFSAWMWRDKSEEKYSVKWNRLAPKRIVYEDVIEGRVYTTIVLLNLRG